MFQHKIGQRNDAYHDFAEERYTRSRQSHWNNFAQTSDNFRGAGGHYHRRLAQIYQFLVTPGQNVLEIGCGTGDLLAALKPASGVGVDFSEEILIRAGAKHPELQFVQMNAHDLTGLDAYMREPFDIIILSDLLNDVWDIQTILDQLVQFSGTKTRVIINSYSRLWETPLAMAEKLGLARPVLYQNWLTVEDINGLLNLSGYEPIRSWQEILLPLPIPFISTLANRFLVKLPIFRLLALTNFVVARLKPETSRFDSEDKTRSRLPSVSVVVPARNESGNVGKIFAQVPEMGRMTELVFVEGHSKDDTYTAIERAIAENSYRSAKLLRQSGKGKGDAVRLGFAEASGDILMILDADLTVPPRDLPRFYHALYSGKGDFINGVRLMYPMEDRAMRFFNLLGNKFFSLAFSWLLGQPVKDTLCGTKVLWRRDYEKIAANRAYFGDFDPFGDFDLLFGAAKLNHKITDLPVRYRERTYGSTNIQRWKHGWLLLKMVLFASGRIKFFR